MTKEEILEKSRNENKNQDIFDLETQKKASMFAFVAAGALGVLIFIIKLIITKTASYDLLMIVLGMESTMFIYKFIKLRKKHELVVAIMYTIGFLLMTAAWIKNLVA